MIYFLKSFLLIRIFILGLRRLIKAIFFADRTEYPANLAALAPTPYST